MQVPMTRGPRARTRGRRRGEEGQGLVEYSVLLGLVAVTLVVALAFLGGNLSSTLSDIGDSFGAATLVGGSGGGGDPGGGGNDGGDDHHDGEGH
jgi:Flp pilus assembly pilin Flp